jgi:hypothetical protein
MCTAATRATGFEWRAVDYVMSPRARFCATLENALSRLSSLFFIVLPSARLDNGGRTALPLVDA